MIFDSTLPGVVFPNVRDHPLEEEQVSKYRIEAKEALDLMSKASTRLEKLDGMIASDPKQGRDSSARNAVISKELLYIAHLCHKAETLVLDEYHSFKGETDH